MKLTERQVIERLAAIANNGPHWAPKTGLMCLLCHAHPNSLGELQDLLEDCGVSLDAFVESCDERYHGHGIFFVERSRLRINMNENQCVNVHGLEKVIMPLMKE